MKHRSNPFIALAMVLVSSTSLQAADQYWNPLPLSNDWANSVWSATSGGGSLTTWTASNNAIFDQAGTYTATINAAQTATNINIKAGAVTFNGTNTVSSNNLTIDSGASLTADSDRFMKSGTTTLTVNGTLNQTGALSANTISIAGGNGSIVMATGFRTNGDSNFAGNISGAGQIVTNGAGTITLSGNNSYTGNTLIRSGNILRLGSTTALSASSFLRIGNGSTIELTGTDFSRTLGNSGGDRVRIGNTGDAAPSANFGFSAVNADRTVALIGGATWTDASGTSLFAPGIFNLGTAASTHKATLTTDINLNGANRTISTFNGSAAVGGEVSGNLTGTGASGVIKTGTGTLILSGTNTYEGGTTVSAGILTMGSASALGSNSGQLTVNTGGTLDMGSQNLTVGNLTGTGGVISGTSGTRLLTIGQGNGTGGNFQGAIQNGTGGTTALTKTSTGTITLSGTNTYTGDTSVQQGKLVVTAASFASPNISINSGATFSFANTSTLGYHNTVNNTISGAGTLMKEGAGIVELSSGPTARGTTISLSSGALIDIQAGTLRNGQFNNVNWTSNLADLNIGSSGTFDVWNGAPIRVDAITGSGSITNPIGGTTSLTFGVDNGSGTFSGNITAVGLSLIKIGIGTQTLTGANSYTGTTTVSAGTLALGFGDVLPDTTAIAIGAATLATAASVSDTAGTLDPTDAATIQIGSGATLAFANSSAINWTGGTLQITGAFISGSSLRFGTNNTGLTSGPSGQLSKISAVGFTGFALDTNGFLTASLAGGFTAWQSANSTSGAIDADHDNDGVLNGIEYFLGGTTNTTGFTGPLPGVDKALDGTLSVTWTKAATYTGSYGTSFVVQTSTTLAADSWSNEASPGTVTISGNNVTYTFPAGTKRFARLQVVNP